MAPPEANALGRVPATRDKNARPRGLTPSRLRDPISTHVVATGIASGTRVTSFAAGFVFAGDAAAEAMRACLDTSRGTLAALGRGALARIHEYHRIDTEAALLKVHFTVGSESAA